MLNDKHGDTLKDNLKVGVVSGSSQIDRKLQTRNC